MKPVALRLRNFLSYGEAAPALDFESIHVACLSGGNGQGKSALLDALTWALWGEARKSSDQRKPDEELLHIGAREMEVDLTFDLDDGRYRVVRSYAQSASGRTSKPGLELQVLEPGGGWRALTAESVRATQAALDGRLGIDYETFINSTFLLQGRSDEFTKKRPGERKDILAKILGLDRYERLAARASARWTAVRDRIERLEAEAERLGAALTDVPQWEADRQTVTEAIAEAEHELAEARAAEAAAAERLATLDATAREAEAARRAIADLSGRRTRLDAAAAALAARLEEAQALVRQSAQIEADHARYETLRKRRSELDERASLFRGIEAQLHGLRLDLQKQTAELEGQVMKLDAQLIGLRSRADDDARKLATREQTERAYETATRATAELTALEAARVKREAAQQAIDTIDKHLANEKGALVGQLAGLRREIERIEAEGQGPEDDPADLERVVAQSEAARQEQERVRERGTECAAGVTAREAEIAALDRDRAALAEKRARIEEATDDTCPTCGTPLTDDHRREVASTYDREAVELTRRREILEADRQRSAAERDRLRAAFSALRARAEAGAEASARLAALRERMSRRQADLARRAALQEDERRVRAALDDETFRPDLRARRAEAEDVIDRNPLDLARYDAVRRDAALLDHWASARRELEVAAERLTHARTEIARRERELGDLRERLDRGEHAAPLRQKMDALARQSEAVGYDAAEHERVGRDLDALAEAPRRLSRLLDVRQRTEEWTERLTELRADRDRLAAETEHQTAALAALDARLVGRDVALAERERAAARRAAASTRLAEAQARRGALDERLARAERDRQSLQAVRAEGRDAKKERALYGHLRRAFGKNGIPSLIIEETLPEVEDRANVLLARLGDGTTRVALETLKEKKTGGGTKETLDIRITDAQGVARAYETYSGGEAFRVNFALRIALSQMLADRAGTRIRTLVVDEGFGTQDKDGLQSLVGAIHQVQDDFDKILVITHLDEIKAAFPVRIEVTKDPVTGSTFEVYGV